MPLHKKASFEYAGHDDHARDAGPDLRPIPRPLPPLPAEWKSKRPTTRPGAWRVGSTRGYRRLGGGP